MNIADAVDMINVAINHAEFDRTKFKANVVQHPEGTSLQIHVDLLKPIKSGEFLTDCHEIPFEDFSIDTVTGVPALVESMASGLVHERELFA